MIRPFSELKESGLLWLINRVVFHPRGFALGIVSDENRDIGWELLGDGSDVWVMNHEQDTRGFEAAENTLYMATHIND